MTLLSTNATISSAAPAGESAFLTGLMRILSAASSPRERKAAEAPSQRAEGRRLQAETQHLSAHMRSLAQEIEWTCADRRPERCL